MRKTLALLFLIILTNCGGSGSTNQEIPPVANLEAPNPPGLSVNNNVASITLSAPADASKITLFWQDNDQISSMIFESPNIPEMITQNDVPADRSYWLNYQTGGVTSPNSQIAHFISFNYQDLGYWGATTIFDLYHNGCPEILGVVSNCAGDFSKLSEAKLGLGDLQQAGRIYRDIRFADFDNDGNLDAIANVYNNLSESSTSYLQLYWGTNDHKFVEDTSFSAKHYSGFGETIVVADFDNDGYIDVYVPQYTGNSQQEQSYLFKNNRDRTFTELADSAGVANRNWPLSYRPEGAQALDWNNDGLLDFYSGSHLYLNEGNWKFKDIRAEIGLPLQFDEGMRIFDYNNDGNLDFLFMHPTDGPIIYVNENGKFTKNTLFPTGYYNEAYGLNIADIDGDGYEDIITGGGTDVNDKNAVPRLFLYRNGKYFKNDLNYDFNGWSDLITVGDMDNNGSIDIFSRSGNLVYWRNNLDINQNLKIRLLDAKGHENQQGRKIVINPLNSNFPVITRFVDGGSGYMANSPYIVTIPLPKATTYIVHVYFANKEVTFNSDGGSYDVYANGNIVSVANQLAAHISRKKLKNLPTTEKRHYTNPEADYFMNKK